VEHWINYISTAVHYRSSDGGAESCFIDGSFKLELRELCALRAAS